MALKTRVISLSEEIGASYWFVPTLMTAAAIGLAFLTLYLDRHVDQGWVNHLGVFYSGAGEGARSLLSTVASSMITVAGVAFSITVVALSLAASQFGPHVLRSFMRDAGSKRVLGTFLGAFIYCLLVLRAVRGEDVGAFVPNISVTAAVLMALSGVGVLIYFIHHAATAIQADTIVAAIGQELAESVRRMFPDRVGQEANATDCPEEALTMNAADARRVRAPRSGYIQAVDPDALMALAIKGDLLVRVVHRPGAFVSARSVLFLAWPAARVDDRTIARLRDAVLIGPRRTPVQDLEFAVQQLAEMAIRALSPGINDPYTAIRCIDQLSAGLCLLVDRDPPSACRCDEAGRPRVIAEPVTLADALAASLDQIRPYGGCVPVLVALLDAIGLIAPHTRREHDRATLQRQARLVEEQSRLLALLEEDREQVQRHLQETLQALGGAAAPLARADPGD